MNLLTVHREPDLTAKDFNVAVRPRITNGPGSIGGWIIQGKVKQPFVIDPQVIDFDESLVRGELFAARRATIICGMDVAGLSLHGASSSLTAKVTRDEKNPRRFCLEVQPQNDMPGGSFNHLLRLVALTPSKKEVSGAVPIIGRVVEEISIQPELLIFGANPVGAKMHETITLQSRSGTDFTVQEIDKGGTPDITVDRGHKKKDCLQSLVVTFPVKSLGHQEYTIHIKVKTSVGLVDFPVRMNCYGVSALAVTETR